MDSMMEETMTKTRTAKKAKAKSEESARDKFLRLAPNRMETALKKISLIGNLAGSGYQYEPGEIKQIMASLNEAVEEVGAKFANKHAGKRGGFSFKKGGA